LVSRATRNRTDPLAPPAVAGANGCHP
jgi:hypothetical protein